MSHLATDPDVIAHKRANKIGTVADFLFENSSHERIILEAKASFSLQENNPSKVKQVLKPALEKQVAPWLSAVSPPATKGYATYSCFREASSNTQSALFFVDPPGDESAIGMKLPPSWVLRRNYSAWLAAMGMIDTAQQLIGADITESRSLDLDLVTIRDRAFVVTRFHPEISEMEDIYVGIDLSIFSLIRDTINGSEDALLGFERVESELDDFRMPQNGSLMSDGTFFGSVDEIQEFKSPKKHYT
ncbi:hypothetical protein [Ruegeria arenilitoris]|uniref:hypothetical protein n=1 Tax=Ruegeria arenilitoris TaxID=1173585 RepID=UPI001CFE16CA|nr:hypothetical protein [Ruegeria arenilitoris]